MIIDIIRIEYIPLDNYRVLLYISKLNEEMTHHISYDTVVWEELK